MLCVLRREIAPGRRDAVRIGASSVASRLDHRRCNGNAEGGARQQLLAARSEMGLFEAAGRAQPCDRTAEASRIILFNRGPLPPTSPAPPCAAGFAAQTPVSPSPRTQFVSLQEYVRIFEPMLLEECLSQLIRGEETADVSLSHLAVVSTLKEVRHACPRRPTQPSLPCLTYNHRVPATHATCALLRRDTSF